jgi:CMP-N,N'-diacetyllegionaminic acid synthase
MIVAVIPARGGSKGIPKKNLLDLCGKPLIAWSIEQALGAELIDEVYVTSDSDEILEVAKKYGAKTIKRPVEISGDNATSESAWIHALDTLKAEGKEVSHIVCMQATSPVRHSHDLDQAIAKVKDEKLDSLFSVANIGDFFIWRKIGGNYESINYDYKNRKRRQDFGEQLLENGSFYVSTPKLLKESNNRLGGKIGVHEMPLWKSFEIDEIENVKFIKMIMENYLLNGEK